MSEKSVATERSHSNQGELYMVLPHPKFKFRY